MILRVQGLPFPGDGYAVQDFTLSRDALRRSMTAGIRNALPVRMWHFSRFAGLGGGTTVSRRFTSTIKTCRSAARQCSSVVTLTARVYNEDSFRMKPATA